MPNLPNVSGPTHETPSVLFPGTTDHTQEQTFPIPSSYIKDKIYTFEGDKVFGLQTSEQPSAM